MMISDLVLPVMVGGILFYGIIKGVDIYNEFVDGAREGAITALKIFPYILAIIFAINLFIRSGAESFIVGILRPIADFIKFPPELLSFAIIKPLSGSGAYGVLKTLMENYGADSYVGRCAAVIMGSAETIFYTVAVYFGAIGVTNSRYVIKVGLISHLAAIIAALVICSF